MTGTDDDPASEVRNEAAGVFHGAFVQARSIGALHVHGHGPVWPVPRQLPPAPRQFVNRAREILQLDAMSTGGAGEPGPAVLVVTGMHGVGKTATTRHWASRNRERFGDGQLYADFGALRHRGGVAVGEVLGGFLRAFGLSDEVIPVSLQERAALYRSQTADKRVLLLLDDVEHAAQVAPLIPNADDSVVLVTTRSSLEELVRDGAGVVRLDPLDPLSASAMLAAMIGEERVAAESGPVARLVEFCDGLPIALRICGARLAADHRRRVAWMLDQLADEEHRLARLGLTSADSLQAVFDDAYGSLSTLAAAVYRRLALHPGPSFTSAAAAATAGVAQDETEDALEELTRAQLLEDDGRRFRLHDLLRLHARETLRRLEPPDDQEAAVRRAVRFYLRNAQRMDHAIIPDRLRLATVPPPSELGDPSFASPAAAFAWFDEERPNLVGALRTAAEHGWDEPAWQFGEALFLGYHNHKHYDEACEVYTLATAAAARAGHLAAEARMRSQLGRARLEAGDEDAAAAELARSQLQAREAGHAGLQASIHEWTGVLELARGDHGAALAAYGEARDGFARLRNRRGTALGLYGLGQALRAAGDHAAAVEALAEARTLIDPAADGLTLGRVMLRLGQAQHAFGDLASAQDALEEAQALMDLHGAPLYVARAREELASVAAAAGQRAEAVRQLEQAFAAYTALRSPRAERVRARLAELSGSAE